MRSGTNQPVRSTVRPVCALYERPFWAPHANAHAERFVNPSKKTQAKAQATPVSANARDVAEFQITSSQPLRGQMFSRLAVAAIPCDVRHDSRAATIRRLLSERSTRWGMCR